MFFIESLIAIYINDDFIRPYVGDVLVVILVYVFARGFFDVSIMKAAIGTLLFSFVVEILQYFKFVEIIGLGDVKLARIIIGTSFSGKNFIAYTVEFLLILLLEKFFGKEKSFTS